MVAVVVVCVWGHQKAGKVNKSCAPLSAVGNKRKNM